MTLFQSLAFAAGFDSLAGPGTPCGDGSGQCVLPWGSGTKSVASVVLVANGVSFAVRQVLHEPLAPLLTITPTPQIMTLIFTTIGSAADYGTFGRWVLFVITVICWTAQYASMSLTSTFASHPLISLWLDHIILEPSRWGLAMALYMIGFVTYGATLVFYAAVFPRLARNTAHARRLKEKYQQAADKDEAERDRAREEYEAEESLEKNRISNISTVRSFTSLPSRMDN